MVFVLYSKKTFILEKNQRKSASFSEQEAGLGENLLCLLLLILHSLTHWHWGWQQSLVSSVVFATCWHVTIIQRACNHHTYVSYSGRIVRIRSARYCHTRDTHCTRVYTIVAVVNSGLAVNHPLLSLRFVLKLAEKAVDVHLVCPLAHQAINIKPLAMQRWHDVLVETSKEASDIIATERYWRLEQHVGSGAGS